MSEQLDHPDMVKRSEMDMNTQDVNSAPFTNIVPEDSSQPHEASWGETEVHEASWGKIDNNETPPEEQAAQEMPMDGTSVQETPMDVTNAHETPVGETIVHETPLSETIDHEHPVVTTVTPSVSLLNREESEHFRTRWNEIQGKFVDEPRSAVEQADALVTEVIMLITEMFNNEHRSLEGQWNKGNDVSTEDLRIALQRYRSFFNSLVA